MLVECVIENFFSFRDEAAFSMVAASIPEHPQTLNERETLTLSKVSTIYGANASGKSNLLKAMDILRQGLFLKADEEERWLKRVEPFHLDEGKEDEETLIEISFLLQERLYRYGFFTDRQTVREEYLYLEAETAVPLLVRKTSLEGMPVLTGEWLPFLRSSGCAEKIGARRLFLGDLLQDEAAGKLIPELPVMQEWLGSIRIVMAAGRLSLSVSKARIHLAKYKHNLLALLQIADPSIHDLEVKDSWDPDRQQMEQQFFVVKWKRRRDGSRELYRESFRFHDTESAGTVKLLALAGPIIEALEKGGLLMIDELDTHFHSLMTRYVLELFRGEHNVRGAQLVYSTHDITNLTPELFRRDQVWFVEKDRESVSHLTSLVEYRFEDSTHKNTFDFHRNYLNGKYGAIPFVPPADWWGDDDEE